ncbi:MAG: formyltetrahydrofolate deformylase [Actinomycetota bacterium]|nr:formyltetrahydrofolate deformylase [Actinomycetota bacterium]
MATHILTLQCPDRPGIVASISEGLLLLGANIKENAQFGDEATSTFCMRTRFEAPIENADEIREALALRSAALGGDLTIRRDDHRPRALIMVSTYDHCLLDLFYRWGTGELSVDIPVVVSNHTELQSTVTHHDVAFEHVPVTSSTKLLAEERLLDLVTRHDIDFIVLARYMQVLSEGLCRGLAGRAINIHHSFLPGFKGAKPYHQAWQRGVKLIGATAHYVTDDLDEGPIIDQDVARVTHSNSPEQLTIIGRDIERVVLSRAVKAHAEGRVFLLGDRTVVFS